MARVRFLNRNRPNWLWAFSFVVVLLPLVLGGCGAVPATPPAGGTEASTVDGGDPPACQTTFYEPEYNYGFDLPSTAQLVGSNQISGAAFDAQWKVEYGIGGLWLQTSVQEVLVDAFPLQAYGDDWAREREALGANITQAGLISLANGDPAYLVMYTEPASSELVSSVVQFDIFVSKHARLYIVMTYVASVDYTDVSLPIMEQAVLSVCVD